MAISIVLMGPQNSGNVGAVARIMKNFCFDNLVLVDPECDHLDDDGLARAMHARDILNNSEIIDEKELWDRYDLVIGTTAITGDEYNIKRNSLTPEELSAKLMKIDGNMALLFGREDCGLTNNEIENCDFTVTIPSNPEYSTLNLSHAVAVILYELFEDKNMSEELMSKKDKEILMENIYRLLDDMEFTTPDKRDTQKILWKRIIGKSMMNKREAMAAIGFFKKLLK